MDVTIRGGVYVVDTGQGYVGIWVKKNDCHLEDEEGMSCKRIVN